MTAKVLTSQSAPKIKKEISYHQNLNRNLSIDTDIQSHNRNVLVHYIMYGKCVCIYSMFQKKLVIVLKFSAVETPAL